ncbi:XdhC family protein [Streptomyces sp. NBC_00645]|uniref:XdhC family protein n=1 Tax=Streptomyces sp. NBC_00645 TaxID=2975795 RepID=UPI003869E28E
MTDRAAAGAVGKVAAGAADATEAEATDRATADTTESVTAGTADEVAPGVADRAAAGAVGEVAAGAADATEAEATDRATAEAADSVTAGAADEVAPGVADRAAAGKAGEVAARAADATESGVVGGVAVEAAGSVTAGGGVAGGAVGGAGAGVVGGVVGSLGASGLDAAVSADARGELAQGATGQRHYGPHGERREDAVTVFLHSFAPPPRMLVFGAIDYAAAVARIGDFLGYRVTVCDARPVFATPRRFPAGVEVVVDWPHRYLSGTTTDARTVICVLTHDPKFDVPLLEEALRRPAAYIGAMGSRRTHDDRVERLLASGVSERELSRLRSPVGLDLGARTPEEVAVSVAAEIVALRWGGSGMPLTATGGAIHPR